MNDTLLDIVSRTKNITQSELEHLEYMQDQINILYELIWDNMAEMSITRLMVKNEYT